MKTLGLLLVLSTGILVLMLLIIPLNVEVTVHTYPEAQTTTMGQLRVGHISVRNNGLFERNIRLPELVGCAGDTEVPLDAWTATEDTIVRGAGQIPYMQVPAGEEGLVYIIAQDHTLYETIRIFNRTPYFSCLHTAQ